MPATASPYGLMPVRRINGGEPTVNWTMPNGIASAYAATIGIGDPIRGVTAGVYQKCAAGDTIDGVFAGVEYTDAAGHRHVSPIWTTGTVATAILLKFWPTQGLVFKVQSSATLAATAVFDGANIIVGAPNARSGQSTTTFGTLVGAAAASDLKIIGLYDAPNNAWGDLFVDLEVIINRPGLGLLPGNTL